MLTVRVLGEHTHGRLKSSLNDLTSAEDAVWRLLIDTLKLMRIRRLRFLLEQLRKVIDGPSSWGTRTARIAV